MKKWIAVFALCALALPVFAADADSEMLPIDDNTPFQLCIVPQLPSSQTNSNVFGLKAGAPVSYGKGRVYGAEISVLMSGTDVINGLQASIVFCKSRVMWGLEATLGVALNTQEFEGLLAAPIFTYAGNFNGAQASAFNISGNGIGFQAAAIANLSKDMTGFQAAVITNVTGKTAGFQTSLLNFAEESKGIQVGFLNMSKKTGTQIGILNFIEDGAIPFCPFFNLSL